MRGLISCRGQRIGRRVTRAGLTAALAVLSTTAQASDRAGAYQFIERRCERVIQATPNDMANLGQLRITLSQMCQCIGSIMSQKLLDSEIEALPSSDDYPPHVEALWQASRGYCAYALKPQ
jgi:hypothetical protein